MKKNVLKKFAAAALAAATVMSSMSVMAFADDTEAGTTAEKGSVTITKYMGATGTGIHCHQRSIQVMHQQKRGIPYYKGLSLPM